MLVTEYLLVDGYNIIFASEHLKKVADFSLEAARDKLLSQLANYQGFKQIGIIVVFDAHLVKNGVGSQFRLGNIDVVFTQMAETADAYIEKVTQKLANKYRVVVATSDLLEQVIIMGKGASRLSARELLLDIKETEKAIDAKLQAQKPIKNNQLSGLLDKETADILERMRFGWTTKS